MSSDDGQVKDPILIVLEGMLSAMHEHSQSLHSIAMSQQGLWECCLKGHGGNNLLLEISMLHYRLMPDERWLLYLERLAELEGRSAVPVMQKDEEPA